MRRGVSRALLAAACLMGLAGCESAIKSSSVYWRPVNSPEAAEAAAAAAAPAAAAPAAAAPAAATPATAAHAAATDAQAADVTATTDPKSPDVKVATTAAPEAKPADITGTAFMPIPREPSPGPFGPGTGTEDPLDALWMAKRHFHEGNYGLAEKYFRRVVEHDNVPAQRKAEAWIGLAASYDRLKRFDLADRAYSSAIAIVGTTPEILNNQGFSYMLRGDYVRARAKFTEALERDPTNPYIQNNMEILEKSMRGGGGRKKV